jgi:hypothetical protein
VIERETLREVGEIMLPTVLCEGVFYSDGHLFFHGLLDEQWNFVVSFINSYLIDFSFYSRLLSTIASLLPKTKEINAFPVV